VRTPAFEAKKPDFARPIDLEEHVAALPNGATATGIFLRDPVQRVRDARPDLDLFVRARVPRRRILPFFDYPYAELMRLLVTAADVLWPTLPTGEGVRRLGRGAYEALISAQIGKVLFAAFGSDFARVVSAGARGYQVSVNFGRVEHVSIADGHAAFRYTHFPAFLETYQVGVVEGAMRVCGVEGEVLARIDDLETGTLEIFWD
jgi:uncharacterized protein (TIGR02265 family)